NIPWEWMLSKDDENAFNRMLNWLSQASAAPDIPDLKPFVDSVFQPIVELPAEGLLRPGNNNQVVVRAVGRGRDALRSSNVLETTMAKLNSELIASKITIEFIVEWSGKDEK